MELEDKCNCDSGKRCSNCAMSTQDYTTKKWFCLDVSWLRMNLFGARPVKAGATCNHHVFRELGRGQSR